mmetsp:Transcript_31423/g.72894  ORF Transcript_31423/g.72894 Transcript_31423/m.72894 type:complete len:80 (-) Transcript_31423:153-392(-)
MGGMSYFWLDPCRKLAAAIMTETYWQVRPIGWNDDRDNLERVLELAVEAAAGKRKVEAEADVERPKAAARRLPKRRRGA